MIISEALAREAWPNERAVGKRIGCCEPGAGGPRDHGLQGGHRRHRRRAIRAAPRWRLRPSSICRSRRLRHRRPAPPGTGCSGRCTSSRGRRAIPPRSSATWGRPCAAIDPSLPLFNVRTMEQRQQASTGDRALQHAVADRARRRRARALGDRHLRRDRVLRQPADAGDWRAPGARRRANRRDPSRHRPGAASGRRGARRRRCRRSGRDAGAAAQLYGVGPRDPGDDRAGVRRLRRRRRAGELGPGATSGVGRSDASVDNQRRLPQQPPRQPTRASGAVRRAGRAAAPDAGCGPAGGRGL